MLKFERKKNIYIYTYGCVYIHTHLYIYIYIFITKKKERNEIVAGVVFVKGKMIIFIFGNKEANFRVTCEL
jgi:hypothetical protein